MFKHQAIESFWKKSQTELQEKFPDITLSKIYQWSESVSKESLSDFLGLLKSGRPIQYILNEAFFYTHPFYVDEAVLIPRSDSEIMIDLLKPLVRPEMNLCEMGVGSGCLGLTLLSQVDFALSFTGVDISNQALKVAKYNAFRLEWTRNPGGQIHFLQSDLWENVSQSFDLIFSNPPYIRKGVEFIHPQVDQYEPHQALYLEDKNFSQWYGRFFEGAKKHLKTEGRLLLEGTPSEWEGIVELAKARGFSFFERVKDYTGQERFLQMRLV